jgi:hypothetical protein
MDETGVELPMTRWIYPIRNTNHTNTAHQITLPYDHFSWRTQPLREFRFVISVRDCSTDCDVPEREAQQAALCSRVRESLFVYQYECPPNRQVRNW